MQKLPPTKRPWKIQVHESVEVVRPRLEAGKRITILIEDPKQAALIRHLLSPHTELSGFLRIALASEVGPLSLRRFRDSEVLPIAKCRDC